MPVDGGAVTVVASIASERDMGPIVVDATSVYWMSELVTDSTTVTFAVKKLTPK